MIKTFKQLILNFLERKNQTIINESPFPNDFTEDEIDLIISVRPYTMTGIENMVTLISAVNHIIKNKTEGAFVECGVWKGGSIMLIAKVLLQNNITDRDLYLYDTYEGMNEPSEIDVRYDGVSAK